MDGPFLTGWLSPAYAGPSPLRERARPPPPLPQKRRESSLVTNHRRACGDGIGKLLGGRHPATTEQPLRRDSGFSNG